MYGETTLFVDYRDLCINLRKYLNQAMRKVTLIFKRHYLNNSQALQCPSVHNEPPRCDILLCMICFGVSTIRRYWDDVDMKISFNQNVKIRRKHARSELQPASA